jgi:DNA-binding transcriptional MerR regulator
MTWTIEDDEAARLDRHKAMLSIGQFSRITGLTIKTIRLYHEKGLLPPSWIDQESGYRYFTERDVERARAIADLRALELSLAEIKELLDEFNDESGVLAFLETQRRKIETRRDRLTDVARALDRMIREEREALGLWRSAPQEVVEKDLAPILVGGLRWSGSYAETGRMLGRVCRQFGRAACDSPLNLYYDDEYKEQAADIESCIPVRSGREAEGFVLHTLPVGRALSLMHRGPYSELSRSYTCIMSSIRGQALEPLLPIREIYRKGPGLLFKGSPKNYLTEIQILVAG